MGWLGWASTGVLRHLHVTLPSWRVGEAEQCKMVFLPSWQCPWPLRVASPTASFPIGLRAMSQEGRAFHPHSEFLARSGYTASINLGWRPVQTQDHSAKGLHNFTGEFVVIKQSTM